MFKCGSV